MVVSAQSDKRLLWDPRQGNKFVVGGGSQLTLYEWTPDYPEIRHVTSKHDLEHMKCFAWSPDPVYQDLMAVGYSTGRLDLLRLEAAKYARQSNVLSNGPTVSLPLKNQRSVNALSFCSADPNYLAVGLDKVRGDSSLVVWDVASTMPTMAFPLDKPDASMLTVRPQPLLPIAQLGTKADRRIIQQHAPTDVVSALTFLPQSTNLILASMSSRYLRLFDLRTPNQHATNVALKVVGMSADPFDSRRVACFGEGIVSIWDTRKLVQPILSFSEKDAAADGARRLSLPYSAVEFSTTRRGSLATLQKGCQHVRMWDVTEGCPRVTRTDSSTEGEKTRESIPAMNRLTKRSWANLPWTGSASTDTADSIKEAPRPLTYSAILSDTRRSKTFERPLVSFALVPSVTDKSQPLTTNIMVVNGDGDLEFHALYDTPKQACWSARGDLVIGAGHSYRVISAIGDEEVPPEPWDVPSPRSGATSGTRGRENRRSPHPNATYTPPLYIGRRTTGSGSGSRAVSLVKATNLAATRPDGRSYSPTALRVHEAQVDARMGQLTRSMSRSRRGRDVVPPPPLSSGPTYTTTKRKKPPSKGAAVAVVEDDISMVMRRRVIAGYSINRPEANAQIVAASCDPYDDTAHLLADLWGWISYSRGVLCEPTSMINGYDFSYAGLWSIWDGLPPHYDDNGSTPQHRNFLALPEEHTHHGGRASSPLGDAHGNFSAALRELLARGNFETAWSPAAPTSKQLQRQAALLLIGWSLKESELKKDIERWENNGKISRAACWLVFTKHYSKAVETLLRSEDESHHMMSGMLAALSVQSDSRGLRSSDLREHCGRVIVKLQDPYLRAMLTHLAVGDWSEVLEEELIPFRERLAIAFQFLDDKSLTSYLRRVKDRQTGGEIDTIIVTGLTKAGMNILQTYVDKSCDIQTAAIMASYVCPSKFTDTRVERWLDAYRDLLDGFRLFHHRVDFDVSRGRIVQDAVEDGYLPPKEWAPRQILIRCNYCNKTISDEAMDNESVRPYKPTVCPHCSHSLPRCSVCLMTLSVIPDLAREIELAHSRFPYKDTLDDAIVICQTCRHGGHASHIMDWFFDGDGTQSHITCAVADCDCQCADNM